MEGFVVIRLILSIVVAIIAYSNGRNPIGWFCFGFLISPLVAGIVLFFVGSVDEDIRDLENKTDSLQSQINYHQKRNDYRSTQIENKIEILENSGIRTTSLTFNQPQNLLGSTKPDDINEKYKTLKKVMDLDDEWVDLNCPIRLCCGQIRKDISSNKSYIILDFLNVSDKVIDGVKIYLLYSKDLNIKSDNETYFLQYIKAGRLQHFGIDYPIEIENISEDQQVFIQIEKILFNDGSVWIPTDSQLFQSELNERELEVLRKKEGEDVLRLAKLEEDNWYCVCGRKNGIEDEKCKLCSRWKDYVLEKYLSLEEHLMVDVKKYIEAIQSYESINEIKEAIQELDHQGKLTDESLKKIDEILSRYEYVKNIYGSSKNDLSTAKKNVLEILKNI